MSLPHTGEINLTWPSASGIDAYSVKIYKNNFPIKTIETTGNSYLVSNLKEGDSVFGSVYVIDDGIKSSIVYHQTSPDTVDIYNFHNDGTGLNFESITFNSRNYPVYSGSIDSKIFYLDQMNQIHFNVKSHIIF